jgi:hypothetical protein
LFYIYDFTETAYFSRIAAGADTTNPAGPEQPAYQDADRSCVGDPDADSHDDGNPHGMILILMMVTFKKPLSVGGN